MNEYSHFNTIMLIFFERSNVFYISIEIFYIV